MDLKHVTYKKPSRPSKFWALSALLIVIALPFVLVKTFKSKPANNPIQAVIPESNSESALIKNEKTLDETTLINETLETANRTAVSKVSKPPTPQKSEDEWKTVITKNGDTLASIFKQFDLSPKTLHEILQNNPHAKALAALKPNQTIQMVLRNNNLQKLIIPFTPTQSLVTTRGEKGFETQISLRDVTSHNHYVTATVKGSLYGTAKRMGVSYKLIQQMAEIFNWEIDFSKDVRAGDQFTLIYKAFFVENKQVGTGEILAATYTSSRGKVYRAIKHTTSDGEIDYFNENGISLKKAFTRYPVKFSHISSTFSLSRMHPVLKRKRPHKGVDLAAPIGTPIRAVGDGRIASLGRHNGYGNMIKIKHNQTYQTVYAHLLKFQKGLSSGSRVKRGQIIGYVGQTGLATGPHCHFEVHKNNQPKNPATIDLPRAAPVPAKELALFKSKAGTLLAQMKLFEEAHLASAGKQSVDTA